MKAMKRIVCAISGGVDSSVAALILKRKGYQVLGVFMRNWDIFDEAGYCLADKDREDAEYVCRKIGIQFHEVNFVKEYWNNVFSDLVKDYISGLTPNPDILCNKLIKFDAFFNHAIQHLKADAIATGHYARVVLNKKLEVSNAGKGAHLLKGVDQAKDQTFFLAQIPQKALQRCIFPLGEMTKDSVKTIAFQAGLERIARKKESTGICFIGRRKFQNFIDDYIEPQAGNFINIENQKIVGEHKGIHYWTIGQRCSIGGQCSAFYVAEKFKNTQDILVAPGRDHPSLYSQTVITEAPYWIHSTPQQVQKEQAFECDFRFQHCEPLVKCLIIPAKNGQLQVLFSQCLRALTPGQFAVFYKGEECLGSARIILPGPSLYAMNLSQNVNVPVRSCR